MWQEHERSCACTFLQIFIVSFISKHILFIYIHHSLISVLVCSIYLDWKKLYCEILTLVRNWLTQPDLPMDHLV